MRPLWMSFAVVKKKWLRNRLHVAESFVAVYEVMEVDVGLLLLCEEGFESLCDAFAVSLVRLGAVRDVAIPDYLGRRA